MGEQEANEGAGIQVLIVLLTSLILVTGSNHEMPSETCWQKLCNAAEAEGGLTLRIAMVPARVL